MCGEENAVAEVAYREAGTPPRVWGRVSRLFRREGQHGDTPTCVGKSTSMRLRSSVDKGHPHVCGEEDSIRVATKERIGTPPRVWGRVTLNEIARMFPRDTPTCVGKSF